MARAIERAEGLQERTRALHRSYELSSKPIAGDVAASNIKNIMYLLHDVVAGAVTIRPITTSCTWLSSQHNQFAVGLGGRYKISKRISLNAEYTHNFNRHKNSIFTNPYAFGVDIETGGHVFQLLFSNAQSTNEPGFISKTEGDIAFGFNIVRVF